MKPIRFVLAAALAAIVIPAHAQVATMKIGTATIGDGDQNKWMDWFKERVEKRVGDKLKVELYPGSQLGDNTRMVEGSQLGTIEGYVGPPGFSTPTDRRFQILDVPGVFKSLEQGQKIVTDPAFRKYFLSLGEAKGVEGISIWASGTSIFVTAKKPIRTVEDFRGLKLRVMANKMESETMGRLGSTGIPMALGETLPAMQTGVIDGTKLALVVADGFKYWTIAKYITETEEALIISMVTVNKPFLDKQPANVRSAILEESQKLDDDMHAYSVEKRKTYRKNWVANGGELVRFTPEEHKKLLDKLATVGETYVADQPDLKAAFQKLQETAKKYP